MFCNQCGSELPNGAAFCHVCGSKTAVSEQTNQENITKALTSSAPRPAAPSPTPYSPPGSLPAVQDVSSVQPKKTKAPWVVLGIAVLVVVAVFAAIILSDTDDTANIDYIETVKQHRPYYSYGGLNYTVEEVINRYVVSPKWSDYGSDDVTYVTVNGTFNGSTVEITFLFAVKLQGESSASISLKSMDLNDGLGAIEEERSKEIFGDMFTAYSKNYSTFVAYMAKYY